ncbi:hypothetical protein G7Z17_g10337 [Cylindrodendrum hubeiense]|uniref:Uncharacterized protein n=1 Tax=Cylindrodendrum hubeiense TaxID=595255 RepID=A0A9P5H375_9HYPO|nr:hypothetical protein G7Z17_g10337 [Cylindrodendrum hubeiense]
MSNDDLRIWEPGPPKGLGCTMMAWQHVWCGAAGSSRLMRRRQAKISADESPKADATGGRGTIAVPAERTTAGFLLAMGLRRITRMEEA